MNAPIALFTYNRIDHTKRTIEALKKNLGAKESTLFIFSDGPKNENDHKKIKDLREYLKTISGFREVNIIGREKNLGLADSIITGVTTIVNQFGKIIVLEDDMLTSTYFLKYINDGLDIYEHTPEVASINGYMFPEINISTETCFLKMSDCWGWGTWKNRWDKFEKDGSVLIKNIIDNKLVNTFNFEGKANYLLMLKQQILGINNSWAIRWYASTLVNNQLGLFPNESLIHNIGTDGSGIHCEDSKIMNARMYIKPILVEKYPPEESQSVRNQITSFFHNNYYKNNLLSKINNYSFYELVLKAISKLKKLITRSDRYGYFGYYQDWVQAQNMCQGYHDLTILSKVQTACLQVKKQKASYERDSVLFYDQEITQPLVNILKKIADNNSNNLSVLDFGGSLGSTYQQNKRALKDIKLEWSVVEQFHFVESGKKHFEDQHLMFFNDIASCLQVKSPQVLLLSGVLQYLPDPNSFINELLKYKFKWILIDRTPMCAEGKHLLTLQKIPPQIYKSSYPCWIFDKINFLSCFTNNYQLQSEFLALDGVHFVNPGKEIFAHKGFLFERK